MKNLEEIEKKLQFADYLINSVYAKAYPSGAVKHILEASNMLVVELTGLDKNRIGPQIIQNKLDKLEEKEAKEFSNFYLELWQLSSSPKLTIDKARSSLVKVKSFLDWVRKTKEINNEL